MDTAILTDGAHSFVPFDPRLVRKRETAWTSLFTTPTAAGRPREPSQNWRLKSKLKRQPRLLTLQVWMTLLLSTLVILMRLLAIFFFRTRLTHESERQHGSPFRLVRFIVEFSLMFRWWRKLASTSSTFTRHENPPGSLILVKIDPLF